MLWSIPVFGPEFQSMAMGRAERKARARAKRKKGTVKVSKRGMGGAQDFLLAHRRNQERREVQFRQEAAFRRDQYKCYKITYSFFDPTVLGSIPQHHDPKMWEALGRPPDMDEIKVAIMQLKEFREGP